MINQVLQMAYVHLLFPPSNITITSLTLMVKAPLCMCRLVADSNDICIRNVGISYE